VSYRNGFSQNPLANFALECTSRDQVNFDAKQPPEVVLEIDELWERWGAIKFHQKVYITTSVLLPPHIGPENVQRAHPITPAQLGQVSLKDAEYLVE
jgi:hypothetical protein